MDVGAGDGGYVVFRARTEPNTFAIAVDASPDGLVRGAWKAKRQRLQNAAFLVESVEHFPRELACLADEVTVHFPWGSLFRGLLDGSRPVLGPIASLMKVGADLHVLLSAVDRDGFAEVTPSVVSSRRATYSELGLHLVGAEWASSAIVAASHSSWAKRLAVGRERRAVSARYRRDAT